VPLYPQLWTHPAEAPYPMATQAGINDRVWSIEELCGVLSEARFATKRIDNGLILKRLPEQAG